MIKKSRPPRPQRPHRNTLAACILARDEEDVLPRCIDSLADENGPIYDELLIGLDTRTTDRTREIAERYGAKVVEIVWPVDDNERDFAAARNAVEDAATSDYIYWQDADEVLAAGHGVIRDIVRQGILASARPIIVFTRDKFGNRELAYPRQDVLHRRKTHRWAGRYHEWTEGPLGTVYSNIEVEHQDRPGGDRPHGDSFGMLCGNFDAATTPWHERHMFYLAREHAGKTGPGAIGHWVTALSLIEKLLQHKAQASGSPFQSSHACLIAGELCARLDEPDEARRWYLRAIEHWAAWSEPYYALGVLCYSIALQHLENNKTAQPKERIRDDIIKLLFQEAAAWLMAGAQFEPPAYYTDLTLYQWRRYEALAVVLARLGRLGEAYIWLQRAIANCPQNEQLKAQLAQLEAAMGKPEEAGEFAC